LAGSSSLTRIRGGEIEHLLDDRAVLGLAVATLRPIPKTLAGAATKEIGSIVAGLLQMDLVDVWSRAGGSTGRSRQRRR
jgi:hypothetical protein